MNKNTYIKPMMEVMPIAMVKMIATSGTGTLGISKKEVDTASGQLGNRHRGTWGDLWSEN
jgi:hypothetical protein